MKKRIRVIGESVCASDAWINDRRPVCPMLGVRDSRYLGHSGVLTIECNMHHKSLSYIMTKQAADPIRLDECKESNFDAYIEIPEEAGR